MMRQNINITDTGLWVVHLGLFQSKISQILEGRVWVLPHSLLLVLVAAPITEVQKRGEWWASGRVQGKRRRVWRRVRGGTGGQMGKQVGRTVGSGKEEGE